MLSKLKFVHEPFWLKVLRGYYGNHTIVHKFGRNASVGTSYEPITTTGDYKTPTSAVQLELVSTSANDTAAGTGARKVTIYGLNGSWEEITEEVDMNGTSASTATTNSFIRIFRAYVSESGTYATSTAGSHAGDITIRESGGGATCADIDDVSAFPRGQSQIGAYTVPMGYTAYVLSMHIHVDSSKPASVIFFQRQNADDTSSPYSGVMRTVIQLDGVDGSETIKPMAPFGGFPEKTDIGFMGKVTTGSGDVSVDFEIALVKTG